MVWFPVRRTRAPLPVCRGFDCFEEIFPAVPSAGTKDFRLDYTMVDLFFSCVVPGKTSNDW